MQTSDQVPTDAVQHEEVVVQKSAQVPIDANVDEQRCVQVPTGAVYDQTSDQVIECAVIDLVDERASVKVPTDTVQHEEFVCRRVSRSPLKQCSMEIVK